MKHNSLAGKMHYQVKVLAAAYNDLSSILGAHTVERELWKLSTDLHTDAVACMYHTYTHMSTEN